MDTYINYLKPYWDIILVAFIWLAICLYFTVKNRKKKEIDTVEDVELSRQSKGRLSSLDAMAGIGSVPTPAPVEQVEYTSPLPSASEFKSLDSKGVTGPPQSLFGDQPDPVATFKAPPEEETDRSALLTQYTSGDGGGVEEMERMLAVDPGNLQLMDWLAFMYYSNDEIDKAVEAYSKIIALEPGNASQHYYLGNCYCKVGNDEQARIQWEEVQKLKPGSKYAQKAGNRIMKLSS